MYNLHPTF